MQTYKNNLNHNALLGMSNGISKAVDIVKQTLGAAGTNIVIETEQYPYALVTNDGATAFEHMHFEDQLEKIGIQFLKEVSGRSNKNAGDGSTTTAVLLNAILQEGLKQGVRGIEIKKSLDECIPLIEQSIVNQKRMITSSDFERVKQVATISSEDEKTGELLAEIYGKIGIEGIIEPEYVLGKEGNSYSFIQGVRFANGCGYLSNEMVHDEEAIKEKRKENRAVYENPLILVTKQKVKSIKEINPVILFASKKERDLVIFTDDMDSQVVQAISAAHKDRKQGTRLDLPRITIIKAPTVWKNYVFDDFAKCVGATIVQEMGSVNFKNIQESHFGTCDKIIIEKTETILIGTKDLSEHIEELQSVVNSGNDSNDDALRRISWLTSKTVLLKIGGLSETEMTYKRLKLEDAINATRSALTDGIVAGGGVSFLQVAKDIGQFMYSDIKVDIESEEVKNYKCNIGVKILYNALQEPFRQIASNANIKVNHLVTDEEFNEKSEGKSVNTILLSENEGLDAKTGNIVNMFESGIIDSAKVSLNAMKNAIGIASTVLTASSCIILPPKEKQLQIQMPNMPPI